MSPLRKRIVALYTERGCAHGAQAAIARELGVSINTVTMAVSPRAARAHNDRNKAAYRKGRTVADRTCSICGAEDHNRRRCPGRQP